MISAAGQKSRPVYLAAMASPTKMPDATRWTHLSRSSQRHSCQTAMKRKQVRPRSVVTKREWASRFGSKTARAKTSQPAAAPKNWRAMAKIAIISNSPTSMMGSRARFSRSLALLLLSHRKTSEKRKRSPASHDGSSVGSVIPS